MGILRGGYPKIGEGFTYPTIVFYTYVQYFPA